jgi:hypothetical protein
MWLLFHHQEGTRVVPDGHTFIEDCPTCKSRQRFREIEITQKAGIWFVDLESDKRRAFRCCGCGDVFDLRDAPEPPRQEPARKVDPAVARRQLEEKRAAREVQIEDELAELKKRLGK